MVGSPRSRLCPVWFLVGALSSLPSCCVLTWRKESAGVSASSYTGNHPIGLVPQPHDLTLVISSQALSPNTVTLEVRASAQEWGGEDTNI